MKAWLPGATLFCGAIVGSSPVPAMATSVYGPPRIGAALRYMIEQNISRACIVMRARRGDVTQVHVTRSTGDATLDEKIVRGFILEVDTHKRMTLDEFSQDDLGGVVVPLNFKTDYFGGRVLGCDDK